MYDYSKMPYGIKQMMILRGDMIGRSDEYTPSLLLKGHWFYEWGFDAGDEVTFLGLADGLVLMQVTKTREEYQREGWPRPRHKKLTYERVLTIANELLQKTQGFCQKLIEWPNAA